MVKKNEASSFTAQQKGNRTEPLPPSTGWLAFHTAKVPRFDPDMPKIPRDLHVSGCLHKGLSTKCVCVRECVCWGEGGGAGGREAGKGGGPEIVFAGGGGGRWAMGGGWEGP